MDDMAGYPRLTRKGDTYYFRGAVPDDVVEAFGKIEVIKSLRTKDKAEAIRRWHDESQAFDNKVERFRAINEGTAAPLSDDELNRLANDWLVTERQRQVNIEIQAGPLSAPDLQDAIENVGEVQGYQVAELKRGDYANISREVDTFLTERGLVLSHREDSYWKLCQLILRAAIELSNRTLARLNGDPDPKPYDSAFTATPQPAGTTGAPSLRPGKSVSLVSAAAEQFWKERKASAVLDSKTRQKYRAALDLIVEFLGPSLDARSITREHCKDFLSLLRNIPSNFAKNRSEKPLRKIIEEAMTTTSNRQMAYATRIDYFRQYREFMEWLGAEGLVSGLNLSGLRVERTADDDDEDSERRRPFTPDELINIFNAPLFRGCLNAEHGFNRPGETIPRDTARYWLPLLGLWTGARLGELCQLRVSDVRMTEKGRHFIKITDDEPPMKLKTKNARREVPLHPQLIKLGFLDFVAVLKSEGAHWLFADMLVEGRANSYRASKHFQSFLVSTKLKAPEICFHSFRHSFRAALRAARVPEEFVVLICGWSSGKISDWYGKGGYADTVYEDVAKVTYPALDLTPLYPRRT